jgi:hypothetical protein
MSIHRRESRKLEPRHFIHIYSNGYTEINYFNLKKCDCAKKRNIRIEPFFENAGNPHQMIKQIEKKYQIGDVTSKDRIFCVIDVDDVEDICIKDAMRLKSDYIKLVLSNPNFELWLLLHFKLYTHQFSKEETLTKLKKFVPDYVKPNVAPFFSTLKDKEPFALSNAKKLKTYHKKAKNDIHTRAANPCTTVDEIVETINSYSA